jgi:DNA-binding beta-propeller fold protein YncE
MKSPTLISVLALAGLLAPASLAADEFVAHHLFVCSEAGNSVVEFSPDGTQVREIGEGWGLVAPSGIAFGPDGLLYVVSTGTNLVYGFGGDGTLLRLIGQGAGLLAPRGLAIGPDGSFFVGNSAVDSITRFAWDGTLVGSFGVGSGISVPSDMTIGANGHLFVASSGTGRVHEFDLDGTKVRELGEGTTLVSALGITFGPDGRLHLSSAGDEVLVLDPSGDGGSPMGASSGLDGPSGLAFGPDGNLYVASRDGDVINVLDPSGASVGQFGAGGDLLLAGDLAFAPQRFGMKLQAEVARDNVKEIKLKEIGVLSVAPGSQSVMLELNDSPSAKDLASVFGTDAVVLRGFDLTTDKVGKMVTQLEARHHTDAGFSFMSLVGPVETQNKKGVFAVKKVKGVLWSAGPGGVLSGKVQTSKPLN